MGFMLSHLYFLWFDLGDKEQLILDKLLEERVLELVEEEFVSLLITKNGCISLDGL